MRICTAGNSGVNSTPILQTKNKKYVFKITKKLEVISNRFAFPLETEVLAKKKKKVTLLDYNGINEINQVHEIKQVCR